MKNNIYILLILVFAAQFAVAQSVAQKRAERLGVGMNLSYLDHWWEGTKENNYSDFAARGKAAKRERMFADIKKRVSKPCGFRLILARGQTTKNLINGKIRKTRNSRNCARKVYRNQIKTYEADSKPEKMFADLKLAKDWSVKNNVPLFVGEFGSYNKFPSLEDRCRHAKTVYTFFGKLNIPNAWWEWDDSFNMFEKGTTRIAPCMRKAIESFNARK